MFFKMGRRAAFRHVKSKKFQRNPLKLKDSLVAPSKLATI